MTRLASSSTTPRPTARRRAPSTARRASCETTSLPALGGQAPGHPAGRGHAVAQEGARQRETKDRQQRARRAELAVEGRGRMEGHRGDAVHDRAAQGEQPAPTFYESLDDYVVLVEAAQAIDTRALVRVLLGGDAGLRRGEMLGLRWSDVDFRRNQLVIAEAVWERFVPEAGVLGRQRIVDTPKSGRGRIIPMTDALSAALKRFRHPRGRSRFSTTTKASRRRPTRSAITRGGAEARQAASNHGWDAHPASHLLFTPRDAWCSGQGHPGTGGAQ